MNHTCMLPNQTSNKAKPHPINPNHIGSTQLLSTHIINHRITRTKLHAASRCHSFLIISDTRSEAPTFPSRSSLRFSMSIMIIWSCCIDSQCMSWVYYYFTEGISLSMFCERWYGNTWNRWQWITLKLGLAMKPRNVRMKSMNIDHCCVHYGTFMGNCSRFFKGDDNTV